MVRSYQSRHRPALRDDARAVRHIQQLLKEARAEKEFLRRRAATEAEGGQVFLRAFDPKTGKRAWEYPMTGFGRDVVGNGIDRGRRSLLRRR